MIFTMNRSLLLFIISGYFLLSAFFSFGQDYPMMHFTVEEGLPSNIVYSVYRDSKGYIWVATDKGIARFNGIKFEVFSTFNEMPDNEIFFFQEDRQGRLWLGTFNGELCFYKDGEFHTRHNTEFLDIPFKATHMRHISVEYDNSLIINFYDPVKFVTVINNKCKPFNLDQLKDPLLPKTLVFIKKIPGSKFKLIFSDKIEIIDTNYKILEIRKFAEQFNNPDARFSVCQNQEYLFNYRYAFTPELAITGIFPVNFNAGNLHEIYKNNGNLFYTTVNGLIINDTINILKDINVSSITQDDQGNYWISTLNSGIYSLRKDFFTSTLYKNAYTDEVKYVYAYYGHVLFETSGNELFDLYNNKITCLIKNFESNKNIDRQADFGFLIDSNYRCFNTYNKDLAIIKNVFSNKNKNTQKNIGESAKAIFLSGDYIYTKQHHGVNRFRYRESGGDIEIIEGIGKSANYERIFGMAQAPDNSIWYSTINGMYRVTDNDTDGIPQKNFDSIAFKHFDFFGKYLIGYTQDNRLFVYSDYSGGKFSIDTVPKKACIWDKMYQIDSTHILISTDNLYRVLTIDPDNKFPVKSIENPYLPLHPEAICIDRTNCYFFKNGSVIKMDIKNFLDKPDPPKLFFTAIKANGKTYNIQNEMELPYSESKQMSILFTTQSFNSGNLTYQFSLSKNGNDNWQEVRSEEINPVNPGYGDVVIKIKARSKSSEFSEPVVFTLHVLRPYWARWWFVTLSVLGLFLILWVVLRYRINTLLRIKEKEHHTEIKFMRSEYKALNALMNPHFIFNTLNNVQGLVNRNDKLAANEYIRVFADLIRQNMHNISKELISLQKEMDLVSNYLLLEKLRFKEHLNYTINIEKGIDLSEILIPPLLIQPLVENSIKHGILPLESVLGQIVINIYERESKLFIEVADNGVGMQPASGRSESKYESFGLQNIRKRIEQLGVIQNKQILLQVNETRNENGQLEWTTVTIIIPVS